MGGAQLHRIDPPDPRGGSTRPGDRGITRPGPEGGAFEAVATVYLAQWAEARAVARPSMRLRESGWLDPEALAEADLSSSRTPGAEPVPGAW